MVRVEDRIERRQILRGPNERIITFETYFIFAYYVPLNVIQIAYYVATLVIRFTSNEYISMLEGYVYAIITMAFLINKIIFYRLTCSKTLIPISYSGSHMYDKRRFLKCKGEP